jgi:glyoxylase-like metal-dependent hydrolase (beta-lactamase superfamily II)
MARTIAIDPGPRRRLFGGFAAVLLLAALFAVGLARAQEAPKPAPYVPPATGPVEADGYYEVIETVADGVWSIHQARSFHMQPIGNVTVIEQADGLVLVDGGGSPGSARRIAALIRSVSAKPVKALILTHWHGDHSLGFGTLQTLWPNIRVIATAQTRDRLATSMDAYAQGSPDAQHTAAFMERMNGADTFLREAATNPTISQADRDGYAQAAREFVRYRADTDGLFVGRVTETFTDRLAIPDLTRPVEVIHPGRGNTDGDAAVWLPKQRILVTGDLVIAPVPFGFNAYPRDWSAALGQLERLGARVVIPGHGPVQHDETYLMSLGRLITASCARVQAAVMGKGLGLDETMAAVDLTDLAPEFTGGDPWLGKWFKRYWADPFVEACWKEATGQPIEQGHG